MVLAGTDVDGRDDRERSSGRPVAEASDAAEQRGGSWFFAGDDEKSVAPANSSMDYAIIKEGVSPDPSSVDSYGPLYVCPASAGNRAVGAINRYSGPYHSDSRRSSSAGNSDLTVLTRSGSTVAVTSPGSSPLLASVVPQGS